MKRLALFLAIAASVAFAQRAPKVVVFALASDGTLSPRAEGSVSAAEDFRDLILDSYENIEIEAWFCDVDDEDSSPFTAASEAFGISDSIDLLFGFVAGAWSETPDRARPALANERNVEISANYIERHAAYAPNKLGIYLIVSPMNNAFPEDILPAPSGDGEPGRYVLRVVNKVGTSYQVAVERAIEAFENTIETKRNGAFMDFYNALVSELKAKDLDVAEIKLN